MLKSLLSASVLATVLLTSAQAGLIGSAVTETLYYPNLTTVYNGPLTATVGSGVEFSSIDLVATGHLDITDTQIFWVSERDVTYGDGEFNGFVLTFAGAPTITAVTLDGASSIIPVSFSFTGNSVTLNLAGAVVEVGSQTILNVTTGDGVPEPATFWLFSSVALAVAGFQTMRQRRNARPLGSN